MTLPAPYFQDESVTIYHGDCRLILPQLPKVDLVLTDPPYGIGYKPQFKWLGETIVGDDKPFDPTFLLCFPKLILWGANNYCHCLSENGGWIIWDKRDQTSRRLSGSDAEMAWTNITDQIRLFKQCWIPHTIRTEPSYHPTQKPVALHIAILKEFSLDTDLILDPFMGSGTTLRAAKDLGRKAIGIEIEEKYCEIAAKRMAQSVMNMEI